jgi:hypothetical protein
MRGPRVLDRVLYRAGLACCPPAFQREYAAEMLRDFDSGRREALASARPLDIWSWRVALLLDLVRTVGVEWSRTSLPAVAIVSATLPLLLAGVGASLFRQTRFTLPTTTPDAESIGLVLLASVVVLVIAMTMLAAVWATRLVRRPPPRSCFRRVD